MREPCLQYTSALSAREFVSLDGKRQSYQISGQVVLARTTRFPVFHLATPNSNLPPNAGHHEIQLNDAQISMHLLPADIASFS